MLTLWLADKILDTIENEDAINLAAINVAKNEIRAKILNATNPSL